MNDIETKKHFRRLLFEHNAITGPTLNVSRWLISHCEYIGSDRPGGCDQSLPSVDLFSFLELATITNVNYHRYSEDLYFFNIFYDIDLSSVMGRGLCNTQDMFPVRKLGFDSNFNFNPGSNNAPYEDCILLYDAVNENRRQVFDVMKHSIQPATNWIGSEEVVADFGQAIVEKGLQESAERHGALLEQEGPRILYCADSRDLDICSSLKRTLTSDEIDLALNAPDLDNVILSNDEINMTFFVDHLRSPLNM